MSFLRALLPVRFYARRTWLLVCFCAIVTVAQPLRAAAAEDETVTPSCARPPAPVYVVDWGRLAELTRSDALISPRAEFWANRHESAQWVLAVGLAGGIGAVSVGTANWLIDNEWSKGGKRMAIGGAAAAAIALFAYWAFSPDGDDFVTIINQWNLRHPDRPLAP